MASADARYTSPPFSASSTFSRSASQDYDFWFVCLVVLNAAEVQCRVMDAYGKTSSRPTSGLDVVTPKLQRARLDWQHCIVFRVFRVPLLHFI